VATSTVAVGAVRRDHDVVPADITSAVKDGLGGLDQRISAGLWQIGDSLQQTVLALSNDKYMSDYFVAPRPQMISQGIGAPNNR
jgi:hypothetical protein